MMQCELQESPVEFRANEDRDARIGALMGRHRDALMRYLLRLTHGQQQNAEDFLQETMLRAWRNLGTLPMEETSERRWLFVVARRLVIDAIRRTEARPAEVSLTSLREPRDGDETADVVIAERTLLEAFAELSPVHREVIAEIYFEGRSADEAATRLQVPVGTVKSRAHYALHSLRRSVLAGAVPTR